MIATRWALTVLTTLYLLAGCTSGKPTASPALIATGVVIAADGPSAAEVDTFSLRTTEGQVIQFRVGRLDVANGGLPAPHLREHLVSGEQITVTYHVESGSNVADRYVDVGQ